MDRVLILVTVFLMAAWAATDEDMRKCARVFHSSSHHCCKGRSLRPPPIDNSDMKECMQLQGEKPFVTHATSEKCDREICLAAKRGFASSDGNIDKATLKEVVNKEFEDNPEVMKAVTDNCVEGDISKYGKPDMCDLMKLRMCIDVQMAITCPEWENEGPCAGIKDLAEECAQKFS